MYQITDWISLGIRQGRQGLKGCSLAVVSVSGVHVKDVTQRAIILECAKICSHDLQLICKDQLTELHMKCSKAQEPCNSLSLPPIGHILAREKLLAAFFKL